MSVIELIRLLTGHSQSAGKEVHIISDDGIDLGKVSDCSENEERFFLWIKDPE